MLHVKRFGPLFLSLFIIVADQLTKLYIVHTIPLYGIGFSSPGEYLRIIHVRNLGVLFSLGTDIPTLLRFFAFSFFPILILIVISLNLALTPQQWASLIKSDPAKAKEEFTLLQRWALGLIVGGGFGNIIDRLFRPDGVVDFIDVDFFGLLGMERWPTFNVADIAVTTGAALLFFSMIIKDNKKESPQ